MGDYTRPKTEATEVPYGKSKPIPRHGCINRTAHPQVQTAFKGKTATVFSRDIASHILEPRRASGEILASITRSSISTGIASSIKIIVGAPNDDLAGTAATPPDGVGRPGGLSLDKIKVR